MLVVKRDIGETLFIGEISLLILQIDRRERTTQVRILNAGDVQRMWIPEGGAALIADNVQIDIVRLKGRSAKIGITAPKDLAVVRDVSRETQRAANRLEDILRRRKSG